ncbi:ricin-type beta-trefoil lectin domain protein [Nonomuraea sp. NPDC049709]|uniref:RICIN domain-containing protein n=1 Tax=Nonomuraea sp. NPDC049709 TaxID=3154736 RepID=UPI0034472177
MRAKPALVAGAVVLLGAVCSVLTGVYVNFATDGRPELNPAHILPAVLFACLASAFPPLGEVLRSRWANRTASAADPFSAHDLPTFKRLLKELRRRAGTPRFAELETRAAARGLAFGRADLEQVTGRRTSWLNDAGQAEPVIRAFLAVHDVPGAAADKWLRSYRRLADPQPEAPGRRVKLVAVVTVPVVCATAAFLGYVTYAEAQVRDSLRRSNVTILSLYVPGRYLVVNNSAPAPPHARLGASIVNTSPGQTYRWDLEPDKRGGTYLHRIRNRATQRCLTPEARHLTEGIHLTEAACGDSGDQLWRVTDQSLAISSPQGELCAEPNMGSTMAGTPLILRACAGGRLVQRWLVTDRLPDLGSSLASAENGVCLDAANDTDVITWECHGRANQAFSYPRDARGDYAIRSMGRCLAVSGPPGRQHPVREPCSRGPGQLWRFTYRSPFHEWLYWEVKHVATGLCLQLEPDGRSLSMTPCVRSNVQQWRTPDWLHPPNTPVHP